MIDLPEISIHALREEGDERGSAAGAPPLAISIHALREEGDAGAEIPATRSKQFLSTPSARRATLMFFTRFAVFVFLSTPSARRATDVYRFPDFVSEFLSTPSARRAT